MKQISIILISFLFIILSSCKEKSEEDPLLPDANLILPLNSIEFTQSHFGLGELDLEVSDEFNDDSLNSDKWNIADSTWWTPSYQGKPAYFINDHRNARINTKTQMLELVYDHNGQKYTTAWITSKKKYTEGFFEARVKMCPGVGTNSAFWIFDGYTIHNTYDEVDVMEAANLNTSDGQRFTTNYHLNNIDSNINYKAHPEHKLLVNKLTDTFHTFATKITKEEIVWYWNNNEIRREKNILHGTPMRVHFSAGRFANVKPINLAEANIPGIFTIDYIRVFDLK